MSIPLVVVDDVDAERYLVRRRVMKHEGFKQPVEIDSGDRFLKHYFSAAQTSESVPAEDSGPLIVLMDINMPGMSGFDTIEEAQRRADLGVGPEDIIFVVFSSSDSERDKARALKLDAVKGYLSKPLTTQGIDYIREVYDQNELRC